MIITCPCEKKQFKIDSSLIPQEGRELQCGSCERVWFYKPKNESEAKNNWWWRIGSWVTMSIAYSFATGRMLLQELLKSIISISQVRGAFFILFFLPNNVSIFFIFSNKSIIVKSVLHSIMRFKNFGLDWFGHDGVS